MTIHSSLKIDSASAQQRSVLTRIERIKDLMKRDLWSEGHSVIGLPKTKIVKIKAKKAKAKEAEAEATPEAQEGGATTEAPKTPA